jgi:hypothetical protein
MAVEHALRVSRRAGRVTHDCSARFVERRKIELDLFARYPTFVIEHAVRRRPVVGHDDHLLDRRHLSAKLLKKSEQRAIHDDHAVTRVRCDVRKLRRMQAQIQRVQHGADRRHGEIELEVPVMVPA